MAKIQIKNSFITSSAQITISSSLVRFSDNIRAKGITGSFSGSFAGSNLFVQGGNSFGTTALLGTNDNQALVLETNASEKMRVTAAGLVGIGTSNPGTKLQVLGDATVGTPGSGGNLWILGDRDWRFIAGTTGYGVGSGFGLFDNVAGAYRIAVDPNGNIGIGTTSPSTPLHVFNTAATLATFTRDLATDVGFSIGADSNGTIFSTAGAHAYLFYTNGTEKMRITTGGNVGIGTSSPNANLHVSGTFQVGIGTNFGNKFTVYDNLASGKISFALRDTNGDDIFSLYGNSTTGEARLIADDDQGVAFMTFQMNASERMRITNGGNVGIGTSSPTQKLEVIGAGLFGSHGAGTYSLAISNNDQTNARIRITNSGAGGRSFSIVSGNPGLSNAGFAIYDETSAATRMYISGSGNVGIGTTIPTGLLEVYASNNGGLGGFLVLNNNGNAIANETAIIFGDGVSTARRAAISSTTEDSPYYGDLKFKTGLSAYSSLTTRMIIKGAGNVGIGTSSPGNNLVVYNGSGWAGTDLNGTSGGELRFLQSGTLKANIYASTSTALVINGGDATIFQIGASEKMRLTGGNLGIGTTSPTAALEVNGSIHLNGNIRDVWNDNIWNVGQYPYNYSTSPTYYMGFQVETATRIFYISNKNNDGSATDPNGGIIFRTGGTPTNRMIVSYSGNVGIGTNSPAAKLDVAGDIKVGSGTTSTTKVTGSLHVTGSITLNASRDSNWPLLISDPSTVGGSGRYQLNKVGAMGFNYPDSYAQLQIIGASGAYIDLGNSGTDDYDARLIYYTNSRLDLTYGTTMTLNSTGIGIGTTSPGSPLDVYSNTNGQTSIYVRNPSTGTAAYAGLAIGNNNGSNSGGIVVFGSNWNTAGLYNPNGTYVYSNQGGGLVLASEAVAPIIFGTSNTERMRILSNGNVGIGSSSPPTMLQVVGTGVASVGTINIRGSQAHLGLTTAGGTFKGWYGYFNSSTHGSDLDLNIKTGYAGASNIRIAANGDATQLFISGSGNVGIGTTTPASILHLNGTAPTILTLSSTSYPSTYLSTFGVDSGARAFLIFGNNGENQIRAGRTATGGYLDFYTNNTVGQTTLASDGNFVMRLSAGGLVGIGTTTPTAKLDVANGGLSVSGWSNNNSGTTGGVEIGWDGSQGIFQVYDRVNANYEPILINGSYTMFYVSGTERARLTSTGNLGIGTTSASRKLIVFGDAAIATNSGGIVLASYDADTGNIRPSVANGSILISDDSGLLTRGTEFLNGGGLIVQSLSGFAPLEVKSNGNTLMYVTSGGNVGIGTTSPSIKLAVDGEASFGDGSKLTLIGLDINSQVTPNFIKIRTKIPFASGAADFTINIKGFRYGSVETTSLMICWHYYLSTFYNPTISSAGSYAPTVKLSAEDWDSSGTPKVCIVLVSPGYWPKLYVESMYSSAYNDAYADGWDWVDADATGTGNNLAILSYKSNFGNSFVMLSNGSVGIGTVSPAYKLDVNGTGYFSSTLQVNSNITLSGGGDVIINDSDGTGFFASYMDSGVGYIRIDDGGTANGSLNINNGRLFVGPSTGNVGIGTTSPASLLQVGGSSGATATPTAIQMDNTFRNAVGGNTSLKFYLYRNTANSETYGFGLNNAGGIEYHAGNSGGTAANHAFYTETTEKMRLNSSGNLGIGTSSPAYKLDVNTGNDSAIRIRNGGGSANNGLALSVGSGSPWLDIIEGVEFRIKGNTYANIGTWNSGNNTKVLIDSNGNIGIGTTTPGGKLEVRTNAASNYVFSGTSTSGYTTTFTMDDTASYFGHDSGVRSLILRTNSTARLTVTGNGNVGIGTTSPAYKFELVGSGSVSIVNVAGRIRSNVGSDVYNTGTVLAFTNTTSNANAYAYIGSRIDAAAAGDNAQSLIFATNATNTLPTEKLRITSTGNVGIGSTSPAYKLDVSGAINLTGILSFNGVSVLNESTNANDIYANIRVIRNMSSTIQDGMYINYNSPGTTGAHLRFYANGTSERMRIQANDGFVGIGTSAAVGRLDVYDSTDAGHVAFVRNASTGTSAYSAIVLRRNGDANGIVLFTNSSNRSTDGGAGNSTIRTDNGNLLLGAGGTTYHVLNTAGSVGIGTTSPAYRLDVNGGIASGGVLVALYSGNYNRLYEPAGNPGIYLGNNSDPANYYDNTTHYFRNRGGSSNYAIINSNGNLGIGTSSPVQKLHVVGAVYGTTYGQFGTSVASGTNSSYAVFGSNSAVVGVKINIDSNVNRNDLVVSGSTGNVGIGTSQVLSKLNAYASGSNLSVFRVDGGNGTLFEVTDQLSGSLFSVNDVSGLPLLEVFSNNTIVAGKYNSNALVISGSSVGIGTSKPGRIKLFITGSSSVNENLPTTFIRNSFPGTHGYGLSVSRNGSDTSALCFGSDSSLNSIIATNNTDLRIGKGQSNTFTEYIRLNTNGSVGIGTTSPGSKLDVNGTFRTAINNLTIFNDYIYVSPTENNTLNSAYFTNGIADMWINYAGYNNGNTQFRNFNVGNGKNSVIAWFDGTNKRMSINNGQAASYTLDVNGSIRTTSKFVQNSTTVSVSGTGQTLTLNLDTAAVYVVSMASGATITTISYTNRDNNPSVNTIMLVVKYAGSASITFTNVIWANGVAPTLTGTNGYADVFMLTSYQGGAGTPVWIGTVVSQALVSTNL